MELGFDLGITEGDCCRLALQAAGFKVVLEQRHQLLLNDVADIFVGRIKGIYARVLELDPSAREHGELVQELVAKLLSQRHCLYIDVYVSHSDDSQLLTLCQS